MSLPLTSRLRGLFFLLWCLCWPLVAVLLLRPLPFSLPSRSDLLGHLLLFGTMSVLVVLFVRTRTQIILLAVLTIGFSITLEVGQGYVPSRYFDVADIVANTAGGMVGCLLALLIFKNRIASAGADGVRQA
jgi:VanZ family protein